MQKGLVARGPVHRGARSLHDRHGEVRRHRAAGGELSRDRRSLPRLRRLLDAVGPRRRPSRRARRGRTSTWRRRSRRRMGLTDAIFSLAPEDAAKELFKGATGPAAAADPAKLFAGEPIHIAHAFERPAVPDAVGQARVLFRAARQAGRLAHARLERRIPIEVAEAAKWPLRLLTAPGYFQAHTAFSGVGLPAPARGQAVLRPASRGRGQARPQADGDEVRLFNDRGAIGLVLQVSDEVQPGVVLVPGQRPDQRGRVAAPSTCSAPTATPTWAKARPTRAPCSTSGRGRTHSAGGAPLQWRVFVDHTAHDAPLGVARPRETTRTGAACARAWRAWGPPGPRSAS